MDKSTFKFDESAEKHFHYCIINTNYYTFNFDLKISQNLIDQSNLELDNKLKNKGLSDIHISEIVHIAHYSQTRLENFKLAYKWFYICQKYFNQTNANRSSYSS